MHPEMYLDSYLEDLDSLPRVERIRRIKRFNDHPLVTVQKIRNNNSEVLKPKATLITTKWPALNSLKDNWVGSLEQRHLLERFIFSNGPGAVLASAKRDIEFLKNSRDLPKNVTKHIIGSVLGTTFERLSHLDLKERFDGKSVLDVGSSQSLFRALVEVWGEWLLPDGVIIRNDVVPEIEAICEYTSNPFGRKAISLERQLGRSADFFSKFGGSEIVAGSRSFFLLDKKTSWRTKMLKVALKPSVLLVIPSNTAHFPEYHQLRVVRSVFSIGQNNIIGSTIFNEILKNHLVVKADIDLLEQRSSFNS